MTSFELEAWSSTVVADLPEEDVRALAATKAVDVAPGWEPGTWTLSASSMVGILRAGSTELRIRPRISIARLIYLLGFAQNPDLWHDDPAGLDDQSDLWPAMAQVFVRQADAALLRGVLQGYRTEESSQLVLRGRLREADQLRRRAGVAVPLEVRYDEYDVDIAENQLLRAAAERLLRVPDVPSTVVRRLRHIIGRLADVSRLVPGQVLPPTQMSRLNSRYQPGLALARMILRARSVDAVDSGIRATGFLVNMNTVFEDYVTIALTRALAPYGGRCKAQDVGHPLDEARRIKMRPDLVHYGTDGKPQAVIDAKYKAETPAGYPYTDLYQVLAYCTATAVPVGHLVYAEGVAGRVVVRNARFVIRRHALDLAVPVAALQAQVADLARSISGAEAIQPVA